MRLHAMLVADRGLDCMRLAGALSAGGLVVGDRSARAAAARGSLTPVGASPLMAPASRHPSAAAGAARRTRALSSYVFASPEGVHRLRSSTGIGEEAGGGDSEEDDDAPMPLRPLSATAASATTGAADGGAAPGDAPPVRPRSFAGSALGIAMGSSAARVSDARGLLALVCLRRSEASGGVEFCAGSLFHAFDGFPVMTGGGPDGPETGDVTCGERACPVTPPLRPRRGRNNSAPPAGASLDGEAGVILRRHRSSVSGVEAAAPGGGGGGEDALESSERSVTDDTAASSVASAGAGAGSVDDAVARPAMEWVSRAVRELEDTIKAATEECYNLTGSAVELAGVRARVEALLPCESDTIGTGRQVRASAFRAMGVAALTEAALHVERAEWATTAAVAALRSAYVRGIGCGMVPPSGASSDARLALGVVEGSGEARLTEVSSDFEHARCACDAAVQWCVACALAIRSEGR